MKTKDIRGSLDFEKHQHWGASNKTNAVIVTTYEKG